MNKFTKYIFKVLSSKKFTALAITPFYVGENGEKYWFMSDIPHGCNFKKCIIAGGKPRSYKPRSYSEWPEWFKLDPLHSDPIILEIPEAHDIPKRIYLNDIEKYDNNCQNAIDNVCQSIVLQLLIKASQGNDIYFNQQIIIKANSEYETLCAIDMDVE